MNKNKLSKIFLVLILLVGLFFAVNPFKRIGHIPITEAKKKTKWQLRLEKKQIPLSFWQKYLPKITRKECNKALKKYSIFLKNNPGIQSSQSSSEKYALHQNISTTFFWVGEEAGPENGYIPNNASAWDDGWKNHFGGIDDPNSRNGYSPAAFTPLENPFYFALPYNDFDGSGNRRGAVGQTIPWASEKTWSADESMCKNRWIKITKGDKAAYAQWEDVGPFEENDTSYVFGSSTPHSTVNNHAGLDVSPAVRDYLGLGDMSTCNWQFVDSVDVPDGPWKQIVTSSNIYWQ
jgi:hypothetical protein